MVSAVLYRGSALCRLWPSAQLHCDVVSMAPTKCRRHGRPSGLCQSPVVVRVCIQSVCSMFYKNKEHVYLVASLKILREHFIS
jgi:hypothetical protein